MRLREKISKKKKKKKKISHFKSSNYHESWFDILYDYELIESSFASQYNIRLSTTEDLSYLEFLSLLSGLMPETPLGAIVEIRRENDRNKLKHFTSEQRKIRSEWRSISAAKQQKHFSQLAESEKDAVIENLKNMFKEAFS